LSGTFALKTRVREATLGCSRTACALWKIIGKRRPRLGTSTPRAGKFSGIDGPHAGI